MDVMFNNYYKKKKVLVIGNTGFKGSWLSIWLMKLGADVYGFSKGIPTKPSLYQAALLQKKFITNFEDINDLNIVVKTFKKIKPDIIFHLAAQPLVPKSYKDPLDTFKTNSIGFANILEALRIYNKSITAVMITSDKVYRNDERKKGYKETDVLHGIDPYSASKSCAEIIFSSYYNSYFKNSKIQIASGRAGNVIGGGDWAENRIIPDIVKSINQKKKLIIKNPKSTRPWQHVLEPLSGYLLLGQYLNMKNKNYAVKGESFNFGPHHNQNKTVVELIKKYNKNLNFKNLNYKKKIYEAKLLKLNCKKSHKILNWKPVLNFSKLVDFTSSWYENFYYNKSPMNNYDFAIKQIDEYQKIAKKKKLTWVK